MQGIGAIVLARSGDAIQLPIGAEGKFKGVDSDLVTMLIEDTHLFPTTRSGWKTSMAGNSAELRDEAENVAPTC